MDRRLLSMLTILLVLFASPGLAIADRQVSSSVPEALVLVPARSVREAFEVAFNGRS